MKPSPFSSRLVDPAAPITIVLPWHVLVPDNRKYGVGQGGRLYLSAAYRNGKNSARERAKLQMRWRAPLTEPCVLVAAFYEPNLSRTRDPLNYSKMLCDSLKGVVYHDDAQIDDGRCYRAGVDEENPRVEITITVRTAA